MKIIETLKKSPFYREIKDTVENMVGKRLNNPIPLNLGFLNLIFTLKLVNVKPYRNTGFSRKHKNSIYINVSK